MAMHRRNLDDRGSEPRGRSAEGSRRQLERAGVEIKVLGIAVLEHGRVVFETRPGDGLEGSGDRFVRRVGSKVGYQLDRVGREHRAAGVDPSVDIRYRLE